VATVCGCAVQQRTGSNYYTSCCPQCCSASLNGPSSGSSSGERGGSKRSAQHIRAKRARAPGLFEVRVVSHASRCC
jgi:hypothetical protein